MACDCGYCRELETQNEALGRLVAETEAKLEPLRSALERAKVSAYLEAEQLKAALRGAFEERDFFRMDRDGYKAECERLKSDAAFEKQANAVVGDDHKRLTDENDRLRDALAAATGKPVPGPAGVHYPLKVTHCEPLTPCECEKLRAALAACEKERDKLEETLGLYARRPSLECVLKALPSGGSVTFTRGIA